LLVVIALLSVTSAPGFAQGVGSLDSDSALLPAAPLEEVVVVVEEEEDDSAIEDETWESYTDFSGVSDVAKEVTGGIRVEDIVEPPNEYHYAAFGRPDPFVPPLVTDEAITVNPLEIPIVSPLQQFALSQLEVVGIWQLSTGERKAMVMTPQGEGIIVKGGDPIGSRGGKILGIGDDFLSIREFSLAPDGTRQFQDEQKFLKGTRKSKVVSGTIRFPPGEDSTTVLLDKAEENRERVERVEDAVNRFREQGANLGVDPALPGGGANLKGDATKALGGAQDIDAVQKGIEDEREKMFEKMQKQIDDQEKDRSKEQARQRVDKAQQQQINYGKPPNPGGYRYGY
jgi:Tfp pilus assembly protein PilP